MAANTAEPTTIDILINVLVQGINIVIFFMLLKYFLAEPISKEVAKRRELLDKIKNAEERYQQILKEAEEKKSQILKQALEHKEKILQEAKAMAYQEKQKIIEEARKKADEIIESAKAYGEKLKQELIKSWEDALKRTAKVVVKKLFEKDVELQDKYLDEVINQFKK